MQEYIKNIGKYAIYKTCGLNLKVKILDAKSSYGKIRYSITVDNIQSVYVNSNKLSIIISEQ